MLPRVVRCQDVSSTWDEAVGWQNGTAPSPPSLSPPWPRQPSLCPAPCRRRAGKAESGATVARWCLWQAGSGPVCAAHVLDTGLRGCLHDALLPPCPAYQCLPGTRDCVCTGIPISQACFKESGNQEMTLGMPGNLSHTHWRRKRHEICVGTAAVGAALGDCLPACY